MAEVYVSIILAIVLLSGLSVLSTRTQFRSPSISENAIAALAPPTVEGICSSMVEKQGYACEEHSVTTLDGYILSLQRIPVGQSRGPTGNRPPVLLQHGLFMDGITWLLLPPNKSLAFLLADSGFDVWIANSRGTEYSRLHISLSSNDSSYWNWSWDELVAYDLPATFNYVHDKTKQKLHYIGHSQGTLIALAAFSKDQLLNMLRSAVLLSPIAYVGQMTSPLARNAAYNFIAETLYFNWGIFEFNLRGDAFVDFLKKMCERPGIDCTNLLTSFTGQNCCLSPSIISTFLNHEPQSTATKNMIHLSQILAIADVVNYVGLDELVFARLSLSNGPIICHASDLIRNGTLAMYDYGNKEENTRHYGQETPPIYDVTRIPDDLPLFFGYGGADALSDVKDVQLLLQGLKGHDADKLVVQYRDDYAHADYVMGEKAKIDVYDSLIAFLKLQ